MEETRKKIIRMCDELIRYFILKNGKNIDLNISDFEKKYIITISSKIELTNEEIEELSFKLSNHRDVEYDFYWELMGENYDDDELELLFLISQNVRIYYENEILKFILELEK